MRRKEEIMKLRKKSLLIAISALMSIPFSAVNAEETQETQEALAIVRKTVTEDAIEIETNKPVSAEKIFAAVTEDGGEEKTAQIVLENDFKKIKVSLSDDEKFLLDKKYTVAVSGITDGTELMEYSTDLTLKTLYKDDFQGYSDSAELYKNYGFSRFPNSVINPTEDEVSLDIEEDGNKRVKLSQRHLTNVTSGDDMLFVAREVQNNQSEYTSFVLKFDTVRGGTGEIQTVTGSQVKSIGYNMTARFNSQQTNILGTEGFNTYESALAISDSPITITEVVQRTSDEGDIYKIYLNGNCSYAIPESTSHKFKYTDDCGSFGFAGGSYPPTEEALKNGWYSADRYCYLDNILAYKPIWENENTAVQSIEITGLKITGIPEDNTWGEGVNLKCEFNCDAKAITKTAYTWYASTNHSAVFPDEWTVIKTAVDDDTYAMTADDSNRYIACSIEQYIENGVGKSTLQSLNTLPVFKISAPAAQDVKFTYDKETMKLKLDYTYIDYNNDPEEGTTFLWEESADKNTWTALSETTDTVTLTENDVEKYIRCTVTVKNTAQKGDEAEPVTVVYTLPFKPTATVSVKGSGRVGSKLTAEYEYFDENGDKEDGSSANWYRIKNGSKESVGTGFSYLVKSSDAGYKIVFGYTPKNAEFPTTGDEAFSDEIKISEQSSGGSSGGLSSGGGGSYTMPVKETKPANKTNTEKTEKVTFPDMKGHWAEKEITALKDAGLINGKENGYCPEDAVTRAEWITMLLRAVGIKTDGNTTGTFSDVNTNDWFFGAVETAYKEGYISGDGENFRPNDKITREEMAKIIISVYEKKLGKTEKASLDSFSDKSEISAWASEFVEKAVNLKLMSGVDSEHFMPLKSATRAEAGVIIYRFYSMLSAR